MRKKRKKRMRKKGQHEARRKTGLIPCPGLRSYPNLLTNARTIR